LKQKIVPWLYGLPCKYSASKEVVKTEELLPDFSVGSNQAQSKKHSGIMTVVLYFPAVIPQAYRMYEPPYYLQPLWLCYISFNYLLKSTIFDKK